MKVYIAGPMSGKPQYNFPAFDAVAFDWREHGNVVASPPDITRAFWWDRFGRQYNPETDRAEWGDAVTCELFKRDLAAVCDADVIVVLDGWEHSRGARIEVAVANALRKRVVSASTLCDYSPAMLLDLLQSALTPTPA